MPSALTPLPFFVKIEDIVKVEDLSLVRFNFYLEIKELNLVKTIEEQKAQPTPDLDD